MTCRFDQYLPFAAQVLDEAGFADPEDGTVPRWRSDEAPPIWTAPEEAAHVVLEAIGPLIHKVGLELGRKEALQEIANEMSTASPGQWADIRIPYVDVQLDKDTYRRLAAAREIGTKETQP